LMYKNQRIAKMVNEDPTSRRSRERALAAYAQLRLMEAEQQKFEELKKERWLI
jgi:hypothetical protein